MAPYGSWRFWMDIVQFAGIMVIGVYQWWANKQRVTAKRFLSLEKEVAKRVHEKKMAETLAEKNNECLRHLARTAHAEASVIKLEADLKNAPSHRNLERIHARLDDLTGQMGTINGSLTGIRRSVELINEHLIKEGGGNR